MKKSLRIRILIRTFRKSIHLVASVLMEDYKVGGERRR